MRIIAGQHRGRKLLPPQTEATRPITDRAKQSLFDILAPLIPGARVYDCFAGTGSMGLESLSRGAASIVFFEADRSALARLRKNVASIDDEKNCEIVARDLFKWFEHAPTDQANGADLIFLDPPYRFVRERPEDLRKLAQRFAQQHLKPDGLVVFRHDIADALDLAPLKPYDRREYGGMTIELLRVK
jgi:16S rRNA (guanine966-N2)-methyltransferase